MKKNDYELLYLFAQGDEFALHEMIEKYKKVAFYFINKYKYTLRNEHDVKELYQLSLITLYRAILTYKEGANASFSTYYSLLLERDFLMCLRSMYREQNRGNVEAISLDALIQESEGLYLVDTIPNKREEFQPVESFHYSYLEEESQKVLDTCKDWEKDIFQLWREGYTYQEISHIVGLEIKKIDNTMQKIKKKLKGQLTI